jgi:hypothetical protein
LLIHFIIHIHTWDTGRNGLHNITLDDGSLVPVLHLFDKDINRIIAWEAPSPLFASLKLPRDTEQAKDTFDGLTTAALNKFMKDATIALNKVNFSFSYHHINQGKSRTLN